MYNQVLGSYDDVFSFYFLSLLTLNRKFIFRNNDRALDLSNPDIEAETRNFWDPKKVRAVILWPWHEPRVNT